MIDKRYPKRGREASLSGPPQAFSHVKKIGPEFNRAATGEREKDQTRRQAPSLRPAFHRAHEGPREAPSKPQLRHNLTPHGTVVSEVHAQVEREKQARNQARDLQMKTWRERPVPETSKSRQPRPLHVKQTPDVLAGKDRTHERKQAVKHKLAQKRHRDRGDRSR